jgi:hypothetical protein
LRLTVAGSVITLADMLKFELDDFRQRFGLQWQIGDERDAAH